MIVPGRPSRGRAPAGAVPCSQPASRFKVAAARPSSFRDHLACAAFLLGWATVLTLCGLLGTAR